MTKNSEEIKRIENIENLIASDGWRQLLSLKPSFDIFSILGQTLNENQTSRILAYLFDSHESHGMGTSLFDAWMYEVWRHGRGKEHGIDLSKLLTLRHSEVQASAEWATRENRRLDLLFRLRDDNRRTVAVIGVENKHWAEEQDNQIEHYQKELEAAFPGIPKALLFLSPDGRLSETAALDFSECPWHPCSYETLCLALRSIADPEDWELNLFLKSFINYLEGELAGGSQMVLESRKIVQSLYQDPTHRKAIQLIIENCPTWRSLSGRIVNRVEEMVKNCDSDEELKHAKFDVSLYPKREGVRLSEIKFYPKYLDGDGSRPRGRGLWISFMLRATSDKPDIEEDIKVLVAAWCESEAETEIAENLKSEVGLPSRDDEKYAAWSKWNIIWSGKTYELDDLDEKDVGGCAELILDALKKTYTPIKRWIMEE